jgi:malate permease and related proteins
MANFLFIFTNVILPIFFLIAAGFVLQKKFDLNVNSLSKVQMYLLIPSLLFTKIYSTDLSKELFMSIIIFCVVLFFVLYALSWLLGKLLGYNRPQTSAFINSVTLYNSGNYCIPFRFRLL